MDTSGASPSGSRFSSVAIVLHWAIAALIVYNLYLGLSMNVAKGLAKFQIFQLHKSVGITILVLSLARLAWRLLHKPPPYPLEMKPWEKLAASTVHWVFYAIMIGMPLTGWIMVSASPTNLPTLLYKTIPWPHIGPVHAMALPARIALEDNVAKVHALLGFGTMALLVLHVGAALKHQFWDKDGVLYQMAPFLKFGGPHKERA